MNAPNAQFSPSKKDVIAQLHPPLMQRYYFANQPGLIRTDDLVPILIYWQHRAYKQGKPPHLAKVAALVQASLEILQQTKDADARPLLRAAPAA